MSNSYKKTLSIRFGKGKKWWKRQANKRVRKYKHKIPSGKSYKKIYETWNIRDYRYTYFTTDSLWWKFDTKENPTIREKMTVRELYKIMMK